MLAAAASVFAGFIVTVLMADNVSRRGVASDGAGGAAGFATRGAFDVGHTNADGVTEFPGTRKTMDMSLLHDLLHYGDPHVARFHLARRGAPLSDVPLEQLFVDPLDGGTTEWRGRQIAQTWIEVSTVAAAEQAGRLRDRSAYLDALEADAVAAARTYAQKKADKASAGSEDTQPPAPPQPSGLLLGATKFVFLPLPGARAVPHKVVVNPESPLGQVVLSVLRSLPSTNPDAPVSWVPVGPRQLEAGCAFTTLRIPPFSSQTQRVAGRGAACIADHDPLRHITRMVPQQRAIENRAHLLRLLRRLYRNLGDAAARQSRDMGLPPTLADVLPATFNMADKDDCLTFWSSYSQESFGVWVVKHVSWHGGGYIDYVAASEFRSLLQPRTGGPGCSRARQVALTEQPWLEPEGREAAGWDAGPGPWEWRSFDAPVNPGGDPFDSAFLLQRMIFPLLINQRKFTVRTLLYVATTRPMLAFWKPAHLVMCQKEFDARSLGFSKARHVCTVTIARKMPDWGRTRDASDLFAPLSELRLVLEGMGEGQYDRALARMRAAARAVALSIKPVLADSKPGHFELLVLEFQVDPRGRPWLLDVQSHLGTGFPGAKQVWTAVAASQLEMLHYRRLGMPAVPFQTPLGFEPMPLVDEWGVGARSRAL